MAYYYAFLDHTMAHLKSRFPPELEGALIATYLLPGNLSCLSEEIESKLIKEFEPFLPNPSSFASELANWKVHLAEPGKERGKRFGRYHLPCPRQQNILPEHLILLLTLPVGSCSCERSFSALRRLKMWCRNTITEERLDAVTIGHINQERSVCLKKILQVWDRSGHRRVAVAFNDQ